LIDSSSCVLCAERMEPEPAPVGALAGQLLLRVRGD
jgi:hypothetical protein